MKASPTRGRGVQFGSSAILQFSNTPLLRGPGFEDEDDDEDEYEAPRFLLRGMLEHRSVGVVRDYRIAPRSAGLGDTFRAHLTTFLPRAKALGYDV